MKMKICALCGKEFKVNQTINGKQVYLQNRRYCLECSPYKQHNTKKLDKNYFSENPNVKICSHCKKEKNTEKDFFTRKSRSKQTRTPISWCKKCIKEQTRYRQRQLKVQAIQYLGGKCIDCGYSGHPAAFDFHHRDPSQKDMKFGMSCRSLDRIKSELDKCDILCAICHRIRHFNKDKPTQIPPKKPTPINKCACGKKIDRKAKRCVKCSRAAQFKADWPSIEELRHMVSESSYCAVAKKLGVSDNAIRKHIKNYDK